jgi:hypothetical protein
MCETVRLPGGGVAIVCGGRHRPRKRCVGCRMRAGDKLCDHTNSDGKTCDAPICAGCAFHIPGKDLDYCPVHAKYHRAEELPLLPLEGGR